MNQTSASIEPGRASPSLPEQLRMIWEFNIETRLIETHARLFTGERITVTEMAGSKPTKWVEAQG